MIKPNNWLLLLVIVIAFGCKKTSNTDNNSSFNEINANPNFNWNTVKLVDVSVAGLATEVPTTATLSIGSKNSADKFYIGLHSMSDNLAFKIQVPTALDSVQMEFGTVKKVFNVKGVSTVNMNYLPTIDADPQ